MKKTTFKRNTLFASITIFSVLIFLNIIGLIDSPSTNLIKNIFYISVFAESQSVSDPVQMYISAATAPSDEQWTAAKESIATRMKIFAGDNDCYIEDRGSVLSITVDKSIFSGYVISEIMEYFVTMPLRFGFHNSQSGQMRFFKDGEIVNVEKIHKIGTQSCLGIKLNSKNIKDFVSFLEDENICFAFSIGPMCWDFDFFRDKQDDSVIYIKPDGMDERFLNVQYYD